MPERMTVPPRRARSSASVTAASLPAASKTTSAPAPPVISRTLAAGSSFTMRKSVAPIRRAVPSLLRSRPMATSRAGRDKAAQPTASSPIVPGPTTATVSSRWTQARRAPWTTQAKGSTSAAASKESALANG